ncbi:MAG: hypothetical protein OXH22_08295 [Chloroflexi bacterium]|nr:hypothetical protein [Chloroflexota bacterium]
MTIRITLSNDVASYLEEQSLTQNKSCEQIADELIRQAIASENYHGKLNPAIEGKSINQVLDDLYVEDYLEKARR